MKILIPTCRQPEQLTGLFKSLADARTYGEVYASCLPESAAVNRNFCLSQLEVRDKEGVFIQSVAFMIDDDIEGFYPGWERDLMEPLLADDDVVMVSARLLTPDGRFGPTCSRCYAETPDEIEVKSNGVCVLPTAAIAFRHKGYLFDENFLGSGWEDNDWAMQYLRDDPDAKFIQSNKCKLIHRNEMKNQGGKNWKHNQMYFMNKWKTNYANVMS